MAARKRMSPIRRRELRRIRQFIRRTERRGYRFSDELKKSLTQLHTNTLKSYTADKLYNFAEAITASGATIPVEIRRAAEKRAAARKAAETRKHNLWLQTPEGKEYARQMAELGEEEPEEDPFKWREFYEGEIIMDKMQDLINSYDSRGSEYLNKLLSGEIARFGREQVARALAQFPEEALKKAEVIVFESDGSPEGRERVHESILWLANLIRGYIPNEEESKEDGLIDDALGLEG